MKSIVNSILAVALISSILSMGTMAVAAEQSASKTTININTATVKELSFLPGVGPSKAEAIVRYRKGRPFKKVEHIMRVKGIGRKSFKKMRPFLCLDGPTTVTKKIIVPK